MKRSADADQPGVEATLASPHSVIGFKVECSRHSRWGLGRKRVAEVDDWLHVYPARSRGREKHWALGPRRLQLAGRFLLRCDDVWPASKHLQKPATDLLPICSTTCPASAPLHPYLATHLHGPVLTLNLPVHNLYNHNVQQSVPAPRSSFRQLPPPSFEMRFQLCNS